MTVLLPNGKVLVAGGQWPGTLYSKTAEIYDPATGTWTPTGDMTIGRGNGPAATLLPDGRVLVAGGSTGGGAVTATAEIYDPTTVDADRWQHELGPRLPHAGAPAEWQSAGGER
jgi:hypothetical protein